MNGVFILLKSSKRTTKKKNEQQKNRSKQNRKKPTAFARFEKGKPATSFRKEKFQQKNTSSPKKGEPENQQLRSSFPMPLNKFLAHCGVCARRKAVEHIKAGEVKVNGQKTIEPGYKVERKDLVTFKGKALHLRRQPEYILLNKPKDCLTTTRDPRGRHT